MKFEFQNVIVHILGLFAYVLDCQMRPSKGICKLEWINFVYILESLKTIFIMYFLQAKNFNLSFCKKYSSFPKNNDTWLFIVG